MIRVAIVEDAAEDRKQIAELVGHYAKDSGTQIEQKCFDGSLPFLSANEKFDIILLDIMMPGCNGMELAHRLRSFDEDTVIIFVTRMKQYAIEGYSVSAVGFLLKPASYENLRNELERAIKVIRQRASRSIWIKTHAYHVSVPASSIEYAEVKGHFLMLHTQNGDIQAKGTLKELMEQLGSSDFVRCSNCAIVNVKYIRAIRNHIVFLPSAELAISRRKRPEFINACLRHAGGLNV